VLIPARDEEKNIARCVNALRKQDYENYEILVLDDNSTDSTYAILETLAAEDERVRIFKGKPLPDDWYGKPFALQQLASHARGSLFLLTDADTVHTSRSISWAVTNIEKTGADFISGYVGQILIKLGERITVPLMFLLTGFVIPLFMDRFVKSGIFSAAVGQYIVIKRAVFEATHGFTTFKKKTSEDIYMSRYIKECGYKTEFLNMTRYVHCRMYDGWWESVQGIGKNIFDFFGKNVFLVSIVLIAIVFFLVAPFPLLIIAIARGSAPTTLCYYIALNVLATATWLVMFIGRHISWYNALLWPVMYCNLLYVTLWSTYRTVSGKGFNWKGRTVT
jgi:chlorobactene glucosyltransferase